MQRIATTVRLNRSVLQFDDAAHARLEQYLTESATLLEGDPDPQEILADLEQAIADKCARRMRPEQSMVTLAELEPALEEIGSLQAQGGESVSNPPVRESASRHLQQVSEGAVISGVCAGLARYLNFNATLLRIVAVLLLLGTGGVMVLVYLSLMLLMPHAPLQPGGPPIRWLPSRTRAFMEFVRVKLGVDRPRDVMA